jgi:hypothetical protein
MPVISVKQVKIIVKESWRNAIFGDFKQDAKKDVTKKEPKLLF